MLLREVIKKCISLDIAMVPVNNMTDIISIFNVFSAPSIQIMHWALTVDQVSRLLCLLFFLVSLLVILGWGEGGGERRLGRAWW